jgi:hypothetical protein
LYFQPFDRITHQRGAFLAPERNENGEGLYFGELKEEIKSCMHTMISIAANFKRELYEIFERNGGMEYYFPKIPCTFPRKGNEIQQIYKELKGCTLFS